MNANSTASHTCMHSLAAHGLYVHSIPGRLRLELPALCGNPGLAQTLQSALARADGIKGVSASSLTSRVLVQYDQRLLSPAQVIDLLHSVDCLPACHQPHHLNTAVNGILDIAVEHVLKLGMHVALGI